MKIVISLPRPWVSTTYYMASPIRPKPGGTMNIQPGWPFAILFFGNARTVVVLHYRRDTLPICNWRKSLLDP
eukprot:scaffold11608_cov49-Cylindrotheca_fusiformis.AAC.1